MEIIQQIDQSLSVKDKCKLVSQTVHDLLMDKKISYVLDYMSSFVDGLNSNHDDLTQINLLKSIMIMTKNYPDENIQEIRQQLKSKFILLEEKFKINEK